MGNHRLEFATLVTTSMSRFEIHGSMGNVELDELGNAPPSRLTVVTVLCDIGSSDGGVRATSMTFL